MYIAYYLNRDTYVLGMKSLITGIKESYVNELISILI